MKVDFICSKANICNRGHFSVCAVTGKASNRTDVLSE
jgi:hypothetical protein